MDVRCRPADLLGDMGRECWPAQQDLPPDERPGGGASRTQS
jgi:hypothetical protein